MEASSVAAIISAGVFFLSLYQAIRQNRILERTSELEAEVNRLSAELDQSMRRLNRARDLVNELERAYLVYENIRITTGPIELSDDIERERSETYTQKKHEMEICAFELGAIAQVIGDEEFKSLTLGKPQDVANRFFKLHVRILELVDKHLKTRD